MKKTQNTHVPYTNSPKGTTRKNTNINAAANKIAAVFTKFVIRPGRAISEGSSADAKEDDSQVKGVSFSTDLSTGSYSTYSKGSSKFKSSDSYGSSSPGSGQVPTFNFSIEEIHEATKKFSQANKIGEGGFGTVYKGRLRDGSIVAIKRARKNIYDVNLWLEFKNEVITLSKIEHMNLVKLFGYLEHGDERIMVVEYVGNGNLREHLDAKWGTGLEIVERLEIAVDVAHAITYLHTYTDPPIIHRDINASNILITNKLRAKVADFGCARLGAEGSDATHISTQVKGTAGYMDPEYLRTYQLSEKSDVYSFGVVLVELMTGRKPIEPTRPLKERMTVRWAMQKLKQGDYVIAMDPRLRRSPASNMAVESILKLAHECLAPSRQSRPSMKKCAEVLWGIRKEYSERASTSSTSHHSANFPHRDVKKTRQILFGIEDGESHEFISA